MAISNKSPTLLFSIYFFLALGLIVSFVCWMNFPGHFSYDSLIHLQEGRSGVYQTFNPPFMSFLVGVLDYLHQGAALFVVLNVCLFVSATALILRTIGTKRKWTILIVFTLCVAPQILPYQGVLWKDSLFAHLSLFGFSLIIYGQKRKSYWIVAIVTGLLMLSIATMLRQQGILVFLTGTIAAIFVFREQADIRGNKSSIVLILTIIIGFLTTVNAVNTVIKNNAISMVDASTRTEIGLKSLMIFDIAGIVQRQPDLVLPVFELQGVNITQLKQEMIQAYGADRVDWLSFNSSVFEVMQPIESSVVMEQWLASIMEHPFTYMSHRFAAFGWLVGVYGVERCLPLHVGITDRPHGLAQQLGLSSGVNSRAQILFNYAKYFFQTPFFMHFVYLVIGISMLLTLIVKRRSIKIHYGMVAILSSGLLYGGSYLVVGIACDFRYLYFTMLSTIITLIYIAKNNEIRQPIEMLIMKKIWFWKKV